MCPIQNNAIRTLLEHEGWRILREILPRRSTSKGQHIIFPSLPVNDVSFYTPTWLREETRMVELAEMNISGPGIKMGSYAFVGTHSVGSSAMAFCDS